MLRELIIDYRRPNQRPHSEMKKAAPEDGLFGFDEFALAQSAAAERKNWSI
jgi:hypothetical protein